MSYPVLQVPAGDVVPIMFSTYAGSTGASVTMTGLAVTDIEIYKDGSVTQRSSDAGYTLLDTDGIDFDGITGIHGFSIDTGDNTDASFYTVGAWFTVVVSAVTVDSQTVNFIAAMFRIVPAETVAGAPKVDQHAISGDTTAADNAESFFDGTGYAGTNNVIPTVTTATNVTTVNGLAANVITAASIATGAIDADAIADNAIDAGAIAADAITAAKLAADVTTELQSGIATAANLATVAGYLDTEIAAILADTNELQTDWADGGRLDLILDAAGSAGDPWSTSLPGAYGAGTAGKIVGDNLNAPVATVDTVVDAIKAKTDSLAFTVAGQVDANALSISGDATAADNLETMLDGTGGQVLSLKQLAITNGAGSAVALQATGGNAIRATSTDDVGVMIEATGAGSNHGLHVYSATGNAFRVQTAGTDKSAVVLTSTGTGVGISGTISGNITGNLSGSVGSVTGAVGSVTGNVGGNVTGSVGSLAAQAKLDVLAEADTALADYDGPTNAEMEARTLAAASYATPANVWSYVVENSKTALQYIRIIKAAVAGKLSGAATTTVTVRDDADTKARITATVDADGNRSSVTLDGD